MALPRLVLGIAWLAPALCFGQTWQPIGPSGGAMEGIVVSPADSKVVYAWMGPSLWRSTDTGGTWTVIDSGVGIYPIYDVAITSTGVTYVLSAGGSRRSVDGLSFAPFPGPTGPGIATIGIRAGDDHLVYGQALGRLYRTIDDGVSWQACSATLSAEGNVYRTFVDPSDGDDVYVLTYDGLLFRTRDGGLSWQQGGAIPPPSYPAVVMIHPRDPNILLHPSVEGVGRSTDGGTTWQVLPNLKGDCRAAVWGDDASTTVYLGGDGNGVRRVDLTLDGAAVSRVLVTDLGATLPNPRIDVLARAGTRLLATPLGSAVAFFDESLAAPHWQTASGISAVYVTSLLNVERAGHPTVLLAGNYDATLGGLTASTDSGASWQGILPAGSIYGDFVTSLLAYRGGLYAGAAADVYAATDSGDFWTWRSVNAPGPAGFVSSMAGVGTGSSVMLFAAANRGDATSGVYATSPATPTPGWQDVSGPLAGADTDAVAYDGATLWAASAAGLFRTALAPMAWTPDTAAPADISALALRGARLYAGAARGLYFTEVAAPTAWFPVLGPSSVRALFAEEETATLLVGTTGMVYEVDADNVAVPIGQGLPPVPILALARQGSRLFAGTAGRGVYALDDPGTPPDAGAPSPDAGVPLPDAGPDASAPALDSRAGEDAATDAGARLRPRSGCSCRVEKPGFPGPSLFVSLGLLLVARRVRFRIR